MSTKHYRVVIGNKAISRLLLGDKTPETEIISRNKRTTLVEFTREVLIERIVQADALAAGMEREQRADRAAMVRAWEKMRKALDAAPFSETAKDILITRFFVVQITHADGTNAYVATTEDLAWAVLSDWIKRYWEDAGVGEVVGEMPENQDTAIKLYFDIADESFEVEQHILIDSPETLKEAL